MKKNLVQFVKFGIVGLVNNLIYYAAYILLIKSGLHYIIANIIAFTISVFNACYWNGKYVFKTEGHRTWWRTFLRTYISYAGTGIVLSNILLFVWIELIHISEGIAPLLNLVITVPVNYLMNKFWTFKQPDGHHE